MALSAYLDFSKVEPDIRTDDRFLTELLCIFVGVGSAPYHEKSPQIQKHRSQEIKEFYSTKYKDVKVSYSFFTIKNKTRFLKGKLFTVTSQLAATELGLAS